MTTTTTTTAYQRLSPGGGGVPMLVVQVPIRPYDEQEEEESLLLETETEDDIEIGGGSGSGSSPKKKTMRRSSSCSALINNGGGGDVTTTTTCTLHLTKQAAAVVSDGGGGACRLCTRSMDSPPCSNRIPSTNTSNTSSSSASIRNIIFGAVGVYLSYMLYGHIQEDLFSYRSIDGGGKFRYAWFLQTLESLGSACLGYIARRRFGGGGGGGARDKNNNALPLAPFFTTGASQVCAKGFTSLALAAGLSFPVCTLAKSAKMIPVMLGQFALGHSSYGMQDCIMALLIVSGATLLSMGESSSKSNNDETNSSMIGVLLIILSLGMDGLTAGLQKRLKHDLAVVHQTQATTYDFLFFTSIAMFFTALGISLLTSDLRNGYEFLVANPSLQPMVATVCLCSVIGQSFVFYLVAQFDPLVCSTVTTTRKISSVLWSIHVKGHALSRQGLVGLGLALGGIALELRNKCNTATIGASTKLSTPSLLPSVVKPSVIKPPPRSYSRTSTTTCSTQDSDESGNSM